MIKANILSGKEISRHILSHLQDEISKHQQKYPHFQPGLAIVQVGNREDSNIYIRQKLKVAKECGVRAQHIRLPRSITQLELLEKLAHLNHDPHVHGVIVQLPLDSDETMDAHLVTNTILPSKDVDGLGEVNAGKLSRGHLHPTECIIPCTPQGCLELILRTGVAIRGAHCVVVGRSRIVGAPMANLLTWHDATVTTCHSHTHNLREHCLRADILIVAVGRAELIKADWIKPGAVVIDCGMNSVLAPRRATGRRLVGDVEFSGAQERASWITPVPGGVGPMTVAMLMRNTFLGAQRVLQRTSMKSWSVTSIPFNNTVSPWDNMAMQRTANPKPVSQLAQEVGLLPEEVIHCGSPASGREWGLVNAELLLKRLTHEDQGKCVLVASVTGNVDDRNCWPVVLGLADALNLHLKCNAIASLPMPTSEEAIVGCGCVQVVPWDATMSICSGDDMKIMTAAHLLHSALERSYCDEQHLVDSNLWDLRVPKGVNGQRTFSSSQLQRLQKLGITKMHPHELTDSEIHSFVHFHDRSQSSLFSSDSTCHVEDNFLAMCVELSCVTTLASCKLNLRERLNCMTLVSHRENDNPNWPPITPMDLEVTDAVTKMLEDSLRPRLFQTLAGVPVLLQGGILGMSGVLAEQVGRHLVSPSGFFITGTSICGAPGVERFLTLKCRSSEALRRPAVVIFTTSLRSLKAFSGRDKPFELGLHQMKLEIERTRRFNVEVLVAVEEREDDSQSELSLVLQVAREAGARESVLERAWSLGGNGVTSLARAIVHASEDSHKPLRFPYSMEQSLEEKMQLLCRDIHGIQEVEIEDSAKRSFDWCKKQGFDQLPLLMPSCLLQSRSSKMTVTDLKVNSGAGFVTPVVKPIVGHDQSMHLLRRNMPLVLSFLRRASHF